MALLKKSTICCGFLSYAGPRRALPGVMQTFLIDCRPLTFRNNLVGLLCPGQDWKRTPWNLARTAPQFESKVTPGTLFWSLNSQRRGFPIGSPASRQAIAVGPRSPYQGGAVSTTSALCLPQGSHLASHPQFFGARRHMRRRPGPQPLHAVWQSEQVSQTKIRGDAVRAAVLHGSAGWCLDLDGIGRLCPPDLGFLPCRSRPMLLVVTASPSSGTG